MVPTDAYIGAVALMLSWVIASRLESGDSLRSKQSQSCCQRVAGTSALPPPFPVMKFVSRGKTAVHSRAKWDISQLFLPDAKSQMHTHSSLPLPQHQVSNFNGFNNNRMDLLKKHPPMWNLQRIQLNELRLARSVAC